MYLNNRYRTHCSVSIATMVTRKRHHVEATRKTACLVPGHFTDTAV